MFQIADENPWGAKNNKKCNFFYKKNESVLLLFGFIDRNLMFNS